MDGWMDPLLLMFRFIYQRDKNKSVYWNFHNLSSPTIIITTTNTKNNAKIYREKEDDICTVSILSHPSYLIMLSSLFLTKYQISSFL